MNTRHILQIHFFLCISIFVAVLILCFIQSLHKVCNSFEYVICGSPVPKEPTKIAIQRIHRIYNG